MLIFEVPMSMLNRIYVIGLVLLISNNLIADCDDWHVVASSSAESLCMPQSIYLSSNVISEKGEIIDSCRYEWFIKKPDGDSYSLAGDYKDFSCYIDKIGKYRFFVTVQPNDNPTYCGSDTIEVELFSETIAGSIIGEQTICYGEVPEQLTQSLRPIGGDGDFSFQWQYWKNESWINIQGANDTSYQPNALNETTKYRLMFTNGCLALPSNEVQVTVLSKMNMQFSGTSSLCYMTTGLISVTVDGAGDAYLYQWKESLDNIEYTDLKGANSEILEVPAKEAGTYYYKVLIAPTNGCQSKLSDAFQVTVYPKVKSGVIASNDTICINDHPQELSVVEPPTGGNGSFENQWQFNNDGIWQNIPNATGNTYQPKNLNKSTSYRIQFINSCDTVYSNEVEIYVRKGITAPEISTFADTLCYGSKPEPIIITTKATCDDYDSIAYQWQKKNGDNWEDIVGATELIYSPEIITASQQYRVIAKSIMGCGQIESNVCFAYSYEQLQISIVGTDTIYPRESGMLKVLAKGAGDKFSYLWQNFSNGGWVDIPNSDIDSIAVLHSLGGMYYFRCIVNPLVGCVRDTSETFGIYVYDRLKVGSISLFGENKICYGEVPGYIGIDTSPTGCDGIYKYQWQIYTDKGWSSIDGAKEETYQPMPLLNNTKYRLQIMSRCDTLFSNDIELFVLPLPEIQDISGPNSVCFNQHELYTIKNLNPNYTYEWKLENNNGKFVSETINTDTIDILWKKKDSKDSIILFVKDNITGCENYLKYGVYICNEQAPDQTIIIRKPNSNILICQESGNLVYQWGYTDKKSKQEFVIEDSNRRYVQIPHNISNDNYFYWLMLRTSTTSPCYSKSYYSQDSDIIVSHPLNKVSFSYQQRELSVTIQNLERKYVSIRIMSIAGQAVKELDLGDNTMIFHTIPITLPTGIYMVNVWIGENVESIKLIAE